jgi:hypothetical protein
MMSTAWLGTSGLPQVADASRSRSKVSARAGAGVHQQQIAAQRKHRGVLRAVSARQQGARSSGFVRSRARARPSGVGFQQLSSSASRIAAAGNGAAGCAHSSR